MGNIASLLSASYMVIICNGQFAYGIVIFFAWVLIYFSKNGLKILHIKMITNK